jgi:hypothetical protein
MSVINVLLLKLSRQTSAYTMTMADRKYSDKQNCTELQLLIPLYPSLTY